MTSSTPWTHASQQHLPQNLLPVPRMPSCNSTASSCRSWDDVHRIRWLSCTKGEGRHISKASCLSFRGDGR